ncbi:MAG: hypothetical protein H3C62_09215, partial [Gemmatimonadaceae bacterium]|nr:hypothetical protein [Gemmatimonadaceae bacterium]
RVPVMADDERVAGVVAVVDLATRLRPEDPGLVQGIEREAALATDG